MDATIFDISLLYLNDLGLPTNIDVVTDDIILKSLMYSSADDRILVINIIQYERNICECVEFRWQKGCFFKLESSFHEHYLNDFAILLCDDLQCCENRVYDKGYFFQIKK